MEIVKRLKLLRKNGGFSYVMTSVLVIVVLLIGVAIFEIIRINIEAAAIRDKYEDAIIHAAVINYKNMYADVRESQAATYKYSKGSGNWFESNTTSAAEIRAYLNSAMSNGEIAQCTIESMDFSVTPATLAPSDTDTADKFNVEGTLTITIPYDFAWGGNVPMRFTLSVKSTWRAKF